MTPEQQIEFTDAIEERIKTHIKYRDDYEIWDEGYIEIDTQIRELAWVLELFNQIKNK